jgi:hypothetical protein
MSSKEAEDCFSYIMKCEYESLCTEHKLDLLRKLKNGTSVKRLCGAYRVGSPTVYDLQKQKYHELSGSMI